MRSAPRQQLSSSAACAFRQHFSDMRHAPSGITSATCDMRLPAALQRHATRAFRQHFSDMRHAQQQQLSDDMRFGSNFSDLRAFRQELSDDDVSAATMRLRHAPFSCTSATFDMHLPLHPLQQFSLEFSVFSLFSISRSLVSLPYFCSLSLLPRLPKISVCFFSILLSDSVSLLVLDLVMSLFLFSSYLSLSCPVYRDCSIYSPLLRMCLSVSLLFLCHLCLLGVRILGSEQQLLWQLRCFVLLFSLFNCNLGSDQVGEA